MPNPKSHLSYEEIAMRYQYNPDNGKILKKIRSGWRVVGGKTGGYLVIAIDRSLYKAHRIAWLLHYKEWPNGIIDHIDGDTHNNRIYNLRLVEPHQNQKNRTRIDQRNKSGCTGVSWCKTYKKWQAHISINGKLKNLGVFKEKQQAINIRLKAEKEHYGEFSPNRHLRLD